MTIGARALRGPAFFVAAAAELASILGSSTYPPTHPVDECGSVRERDQKTLFFFLLTKTCTRPFFFAQILAIEKLDQETAINTRLIAETILRIFLELRRKHKHALRDAELVLGIERCMVSIAQGVQQNLVDLLRQPLPRMNDDLVESLQNLQIHFYAHDGSPTHPAEQQLQTVRHERSRHATAAATFPSHLRMYDILVGPGHHNEEVGIQTKHWLKSHMANLVARLLKAQVLRIVKDGLTVNTRTTFPELADIYRTELRAYSSTLSKMKRPPASSDPLLAAARDPIPQEYIYHAGPGAKDDMVMCTCFLALMCATCPQPELLPGISNAHITSPDTFTALRSAIGPQSFFSR
jgi:hypothetical protein